LGHVEPYAEFERVGFKGSLLCGCFGVHGYCGVLIDDSGQMQDGFVVLFKGFLVLFLSEEGVSFHFKFLSLSEINFIVPYLGRRW
jgi:hypothetical protein